MKSRSNYVMEVAGEADRLEKQATISAYDVKSEFDGIQVGQGNRVLDAGCGTGVVTRYLASKFSHALIEACDLSQERLQVARDQSPSQDVVYFESDLSAIPRVGHFYDLIVSRYVFEHLPKPEEAMPELMRVLKPSGTLRVVDLDGLLVNMHPRSDELSALLEEALRFLPVDLCVGRRLPELMANAGFENIQWRVEAHGFQGDQLQTEKVNMAERLVGARKGLEVALKSELRARRLEKLILAELEHPQLVLFLNKFIVDGQKP